MAGKYITIGLGTSKEKDSYKAAKEAAKEAIKKCERIPGFSIVYVNSACDPKKVLKGINEMLGKNWVGGSMDKMFNNETGYDPDLTVSVLCISSKYLRFNTAVSENYKKNTKQKAFLAVKKAVETMEGGTYIDALVQYSRTKNKSYGNIIKTPPYFIFTILRSQIKKDGKYIGGEEIPFLEGILEYTGPNVPMFGLGSGYDFEKFINPKMKTAKSFQFANGRFYTDSGIVVFVISNLYFEISVEHGYSFTKDFVIVTKLDKTGHKILELNGKEPVKEYCRLVGVTKEKFLKNPEDYSLTRPLGLVGLDNESFIKEAFPTPNGRFLYCTYKLKPNTIMNILQCKKAKLYTSMVDTLAESRKNNKRTHKIVMALFCNCCSRRLLMGKTVKKATMLVQTKHKSIPFFGAYAFSEIGSTKTSSAQVHGETVTSLILYDKLLSED